MTKKSNHIYRRQFLKLCSIIASGIAFLPAIPFSYKEKIATHPDYPFLVRCRECGHFKSVKGYEKKDGDSWVATGVVCDCTYVLCVKCNSRFPMLCTSTFNEETKRFSYTSYLKGYVDLSLDEHDCYNCGSPNQRGNRWWLLVKDGKIEK